MSGILVNIAKVANGEVENAQAIITAQDADRKGFASFELGNFFNTSVPVLKNFSEFEVNGSLSRFQSGDETVKYLGNDVGDTLEDATSAPHNVPLYLCILPYTATTFEFVVRAGITVAYDNAFGGIYENGTTTRIIGGCVYDGSSWTNKWVINNTELLAPLFKMYADGLEGIFRKITCYNPGKVADPISNYVPTSAVAASGVIPTEIPVQYPCLLFVWITYASTPIFVASPEVSNAAARFIELQRKHTDGTWISVGRPVRIDGLSAIHNNKSVYLPINVPGTYRICISAGTEEVVTGYDQYGHEITGIASGGIGKVSVSVLSILGSTVDY